MRFDYVLDVMLDGHSPLRVPLRQRGFSVGSSPFNDLTFDDPEMARRQFTIMEDDEGHVLLDRSGTGTLVNEARAERRALVIDDVIRAGGVSFRYGRQEPVQPAPSGGTQLFGREASEASSVGELCVPGPDGERRIPLDRPLLIGSGSDVHVEVADPFASRRHCQLIPSSEGLVLRDLQSLNGTWIGGLRVMEVVLPSEAEFCVGQTTLRVRGPAPKERRDVIEKPFHGMIGRHPAMLRLFGLIRRMAPLDQTVLLLGETGTGKELAARAIHAESARAREPFVSVNSGALSPELIESELFGHERGAFTGATERRAGAFESAKGGTVFLDEIGELPLGLQAKLLRALENQEVKPVGSDRPRRHQARVVAATNRDLLQLVKAGTFRQDLYYRLHVLPIQLPALRDRRDDIPLLAAAILAESAPGVRLTPEAAEALMHAYWAGNVRELRNVLLMSLCYHPEAAASGWLDEDHLLFARLKSEADLGASGGTTLQQAEARLIAEALTQYGGNKRQVAHALGISKTTLYEKIRKYALAGGDA